MGEGKKTLKRKPCMAAAALSPPGGLGGEPLSLCERRELAHVEQAQAGLEAAPDVGLGAGLEVEVDDAELLGEALHQRE